ncbi:hypothetical protein D9M72_184450 [compost metagenome]
MRRLLICFAFISLMPAVAGAYEADVHFGLTRWLAIQAGFTGTQADVVATGDQRVDGGLMDTQYVLLDYGCAKPDVETAQSAQAKHFPASGKVPSLPKKRIVTPQDPAASAAVESILIRDPKQAPFLLLKLGEALHPLQDAWAHQGTPSVPALSMTCDPRLAMKAPDARGAGHRTDIASTWPQDAIDMAADTFARLQRFPAINGVTRTPADWKQLRPQIEDFLRANTKEEKARWFVERGFNDVSFLEGTSLPDGGRPWTTVWPGRRLPAVKWDGPRQWDAPEEAQRFFKTFFSVWLGSSDPAAALDTGVSVTSTDLRGSVGRKELAMRLRLWRVRDHGRVSELLHTDRPLDAHQMRIAEGYTRSASVYVSCANPADAFFPLMGVDKRATPVVPFLVRELSDEGGIRSGGKGPSRFRAIAKFRHAPYDEVAFTAERTNEGWRIVSVESIVDH